MSDHVLLIAILFILTILFGMISCICIHVFMCSSSESNDSGRDTLSVDEILCALHHAPINKDSGISRSNTTIEL